MTSRLTTRQVKWHDTDTIVTGRLTSQLMGRLDMCAVTAMGGILAKDLTIPGGTEVNYASIHELAFIQRSEGSGAGEMGLTSEGLEPGLKWASFKVVFGEKSAQTSNVNDNHKWTVLYLSTRSKVEILFKPCRCKFDGKHFPKIPGLDKLEICFGRKLYVFTEGPFSTVA